MTTKTEFAAALAAKTNITKKLALEITEAIFNVEGGVITTALSADGEVTLHGFGSFALKGRAARKARNPATGQMVDVAAKVFPHFKPSSLLKKAF